MTRENRCAFVYCRQKFPIEEYDITPHAIIGALCIEMKTTKTMD